MIRRTLKRSFPVACIAAPLVLACTAIVHAQGPAAAAKISEREIVSLEKEFAEYRTATSSTSMRRILKGAVRAAEDLLDDAPAAPNRFRVLAVMLESQKRLLALENSSRNREALFETCSQLAEAPDEYAAIRLEADLLLSERALTLKNADVKQRADALRALLARYRDTPAEAKSLMMAAMIAPRLEAFDLEREIVDTMDERFADDHTVIEWRRSHLAVASMDVLFAGTFTRADGTTLKFPIDRMGHHCLMIFWSSKKSGFEENLKQFDALRDNYPDLFTVYSFNLDELPDAGRSILRRLELDWTAMRLPGGKQSQAYRTYARTDPACILVNGFGHTILMPTNVAYGQGVRSGRPVFADARISHDRYLAQLQSLFIGDFLVTGLDGTLDPVLPPELMMIAVDDGPTSVEKLSRTEESVPAETLQAIQACFTLPPTRYRLTSDEALANYTKARELCLDAIKQYSKDPNLWIVRNRLIISLLGMWNLAGEPKYLTQAVEQSHAVLAEDLPPAAAVVGRFCLAKQSLRQDASDPKSVLSTLVEASGGEQAPASALAAAAILALDVHAKDLHDHYRSKFIDAPYDGNPSLWSFVSFLRDRYHRYNLLKANYIRHERKDISPRGYIVAHAGLPTNERLPNIELKTLDGKTLNLPQDTNGKLTLLVFVEPPEVIETEPELDARGRPKKRRPNVVMGYAKNLAERHIYKELEAVAVFLCDDPKKVEAMIELEEWTGRAAMVPGGLANPMVRRLGVYSADRIPNVFLLHRDGTIAWQTSGFRYKDEFSTEFSIYLAMKVHTEVCESETAYQALQQGDFEKAAKIFAGPFLPEQDERYRWRAPRFHGRALANIGLKDWDAALADIDTAIEAHQNDFRHAMARPCSSMVEMQATKAIILEKLGRTAEAKAARRLATASPTPYPTTPYSAFHEKLKKLRLNQR